MADNSALVYGIQKKIAYDPLVDVDAPRVYIIEKSGATVALNNLTLTNYTDSQIQFNLSVDSLETIVDKYLVVGIPMQTTFVGPSPSDGSNLLQLNQGVLALRSFPINQISQTVAWKINNVTLSTNNWQYMSAFQHCRVYQHDTNIYCSTFPSLPDNCQQYTDMLGASNNPLNPFTSSDYYQQGRGSFPFTVSSYTNVDGVATEVINTMIYEPLLCPPMLFKANDLENGLIGVSTLQLTISFVNSLSRIWSYNATDGHALTSVTTHISSGPSLYYKFISPLPTYKLPESVDYDYSTINVYSNGNKTVASGVATGLISTGGVIQLDQIPSKVYVFARRQDADASGPLGYTYADGFAFVSQVSINFNVVTGILSTAQPNDLWRLSAKNGVNIPWDAWSGSGPTSTYDGLQPITTGSVLCFKPVEDWGLNDPTLAPGIYGQKFNLQVYMNFTNPSNSSINYTMFIVTCVDSVLTVYANGQAVTLQGILTKQEILNTPIKDKVPIATSTSPYGGSWFSDLKQLAKDKKLLSKGLSAISSFAPNSGLSTAADIASNVSNALGYGGKRTTKREIENAMYKLGNGSRR